MYYVCYITMKSRSLKKKYKIAFFLYQFGKVLKKKVLEHLVVLHLHTAARSVHYYYLHGDNLAAKC